MAAQVVVPSTAIVLEVLDTDNYKDWSVRVKTYLLANDLWDAIEFEAPKEDEPEFKTDAIELQAPREDEPEFKTWRKKNAKALHVIQISCGHYAFSLIRNIDTAAEAWDTLAANITPAAQEVEDDTGSGGASDSGAVTTSSRRQQAPPVDTGTGQSFIMAEAEETVEMNEVQEKNSSHDNSHKHGRWYKDFPEHEALINDVANGNLDSVKELLATDPEARRARGVLTGYTILHVAVMCDQVHVVKALVEKMTELELEARSRRGFTALALAVDQHPASVTQMVEFMVEKNKKLLAQGMEPKNYIPLCQAYRHGKWELARYLYSVTPLRVLLEDNGRHGAYILGMSFLQNEHDIAGHLIQRCPNLAVAKIVRWHSPLYALANQHSSFLSGTPLRFWQRWIYDNIHIQPAASGIHDFRVEIPKLENDASNQSVPLVRYVVRLLRGLVQHLLTLLGIDRIYKIKLNHVRTLEILDCMCKAITKDRFDRSQQVRDVVQSTINRAVEEGNVEIITRMCKETEDIVHVHNKSGRSIFHHAVRFRQERVLCLLFGLKKEMRNSFLDNSALLHSAAELSQPALHRLKAIKGAALQMQRELQWFKEVEDNVPPNLHAIVRADNLTARERFTKDHAKLMEEGEKSMKKTATSYTVVGALILTIMFAAAFTIPGGNNEDVDYPMFVHEDLFMTFLVFDIISLFSSATSVMIFLGILTSRYAEDDFLISLPTKMILGLLTLFLSIAAMMIAFVSALLFMLHGKTWIITPVTLLACVPIASFAWMQYPLLHDLFTATYGPGIFDKNVKPWLPDM